MARRLRIEFAGALYHVTSRGNAREGIYLGDADHDAAIVEAFRSVGDTMKAIADFADPRYSRVGRIISKSPALTRGNT